MAYDTKDAKHATTFKEAGEECYHEHCNSHYIRWSVPKNVFIMNAIVYGLSSAVADYARREVDTHGVGDVTGFIIYLGVIMLALFGMHTGLFFLLGWGGAMLATPDQIMCANIEFFTQGKTEHCHNAGDAHKDAYHTHSALHTTQPPFTSSM